MTIRQEIQSVITYLDAAPRHASDFVEAAAKLDTLEQLTMLKKPASDDPDWGAMMHLKLCPCPGVPREVWDPETECDE